MTSLNASMGNRDSLTSSCLLCLLLPAKPERATSDHKNRPGDPKKSFCRTKNSFRHAKNRSRRDRSPSRRDENGSRGGTHAPGPPSAYHRP